MFHQLLVPVGGSLLLSFLVAALPIATVLVVLGILNCRPEAPDKDARSISTEEIRQLLAVSTSSRLHCIGTHTIVQLPFQGDS